VLYFLVGSMWGARASWRGLALGTLVFGLLFGFGAGWRGAYLNWDDPRELWYTAGPVSNDAHELHDTLREMSLRATGEPHLIDIVAWVPENGALAWVLRDFPNTTFVSGTGAEINAAAVIVPVGGTRQRMGADYVGKELSISPAWDISALSWRDELLWFYRAASKANPTPGEQVMLWIRKDVYGVEQVTEN
jgi:hypothetical protein